MHRLRQHILKSLILNPTLRYARLKPDEVEGNLFMYHLKQLIQEGLVRKRVDGLYELTAQGKQFADGYSLAEMKPRAQPRIVTLMVLANDRGQLLLYRRKRQPLIGMIGFPYGKIHLGEKVAGAATRELKEKTGLNAMLRHRGDGYATIYSDGEAISQIMFHLFSGTNPVGELLADSRVGEAFWANPNDLSAEELLPTVFDLLRLMRNNPTGRFFSELVYHVEAAEE